MREFGLDETAAHRGRGRQAPPGAEDAHQDGQDARLPDPPGDQRPPAREARRPRDPRGDRLDAQRHGHRRLRAGARRGDAADRRRRRDHRHRGRGRGSRRGGALDRRLRVRPHDRPGAHVHARDGHGRAAHARRRDRDRQAHRRRPAGDDAGDQRLADDDRRDPRLRRPDRLGRDEDLRGRRRLRLRGRGRRLRRRGRRRLLRRGGRRRRQRRLEGADQEARGAEGGGAGEVRLAAHQLRQDAQGVREGRLPVARLQPRPAGDQLRADDDPLHRQDDREAVRDPALAGRRRAPLRARAAQDPGRQVRHAAGILHQELPAQHPQPEVGREGSGGRQALQRDPGAQPAAGAGAAEEADRAAGARRRAARGPEAHQQAHERGREAPRATPRRR